MLHGERIEDRITTADTMVPLPTREAFAVDRQWPRTMLTALKGWWDRFCEYEKKDDVGVIELLLFLLFYFTSRHRAPPQG